MSASYPTQVKNFLLLQDGIDKVLAQHPNERGDEITAVQTMLGAIGVGQAYTESFKNTLLGYRRGCHLEYKSATDLYVRLGEISVPDVSNNLRFRRNISDLTVDWSMLDTGAEASNTTYYVYAVADASATTFTVKISTSASAPAGATFYRRLGSFVNNASGDISKPMYNDVPCFLAVDTTRAPNTVYQAECDLLVYFYVSTGGNGADINMITDSSASPSTVLGKVNIANGIYPPCSMSVKKGDYWNVSIGGGYGFTPVIVVRPLSI